MCRYSKKYTGGLSVKKNTFIASSPFIEGFKVVLSLKSLWRLVNPAAITDPESRQISINEILSKMRTYLISIFIFLQTFAASALDYYTPRFFSSAIRCDSVVVRCDIKLPTTDEPEYQGIAITKIFSYQDGSKETFCWPSKKASRIVSNEVLLEYVPILYHSFLEYSQKANLRKGYSYSVPLVICRTPVKMEAKNRNARVEELSRTSSSLAKSEYSKRLGLSKSSLRRMADLRRFAIATIPDNVICDSDSLMFIELVGKDKSIKGESLYVQCSSDKSTVWSFHSTGHKNSQEFLGKEETDSLTGVRKIVNYVRRADIKSLTERYSVSDEVDSYYYYILLLKRVDQQFVPGIYLQTNKSDWFD